MSFIEFFSSKLLIYINKWKVLKRSHTWAGVLWTEFEKHYWEHFGESFIHVSLFVSNFLGHIFLVTFFYFKFPYNKLLICLFVTENLHHHLFFSFLIVLSSVLATIFCYEKKHKPWSYSILYFLISHYLLLCDVKNPQRFGLNCS